jgi:hypothetical protein
LKRSRADRRLRRERSLDRGVRKVRRIPPGVDSGTITPPLDCE